MIYLPMIYSVNTNQVSVISNIFCLNISTKLEVNLIPQVKVIVKKSTAGKIFNIDHTPCLSTPVGTTWLTGENVKFSKNFRGETHESVSVEEAKKPIGENIKIQQVELTNILRWFKNISIRLTKNTKVAEQPLSVKNLWNISLAINASYGLKMESNIRNFRYIMHLKIKFTLKSHDASIWTDCTIQQSHFHQSPSHHYHTWKTNRYTKQVTSPDVQYHCTYWKLKFWI